MSTKFKKALIIAIAAFLTAVSGYSIAPDVLEALCIKASLCEVTR